MDTKELKENFQLWYTKDRTLQNEMIGLLKQWAK